MFARLMSLMLVTLASLSGVAWADTHSMAGQYDQSATNQAAISRLLRYEQLEHQVRVRQLEAGIQVTRAEIAAMRRLQQQYEPATRFKGSYGFSITTERLAVDLLAAELRLRNLTSELRAIRRQYPVQLRLLALEFEQTQAR
ncbi:MAG: hypothetical protein AAGF31_08170 [Planctomycetota bacterium]